MDRAGEAEAGTIRLSGAPLAARDHERRWRRERPHEHVPGRQHHPGLRSHGRGQRGPGHELDPRQHRGGAAVHRGHPRQPPRPLLGLLGTRRVRHRLAAPHARLQRLRQRLTGRAGGGAAQWRAGSRRATRHERAHALSRRRGRGPALSLDRGGRDHGGQPLPGPLRSRRRSAIAGLRRRPSPRRSRPADRRDEIRRERAVAARAGVLGPGAARRQRSRSLERGASAGSRRRRSRARSGSRWRAPASCVCPWPTFRPGPSPGGPGLARRAAVAPRPQRALSSRVGRPRVPGRGLLHRLHRPRVLRPLVGPPGSAAARGPDALRAAPPLRLRPRRGEPLLRALSAPETPTPGSGTSPSPAGAAAPGRSTCRGFKPRPRACLCACAW